MPPTDPDAGLASVPLSPEDLAFWYADQPRQRTTMAMLLLLDQRPDPGRLRAAAQRMVESVPRLRQRVVDAPLGLALPRWEEDPTFDLDFHVRRYGLAADAEPTHDLDALFRTIGPIYERPFDRTRPLWEMLEIDRPGAGAAIFFRLHHAVADGVGGNAILAALTDAERAGEPLPPPSRKPPGAWSEPSLAGALVRAARDRAGQDVARARALAGALLQAAREPASLLRAARITGALLADLGVRTRSPLRDFGRARRLSGIELPFEPLREAKRALGGQMIDLMLTAVTGAAGAWHRAHRLGSVSDLNTLVPINLRPPTARGLGAGVGNRATGIVVPLPIRIRDPRARFRAVHRRVTERKQHPATSFLPTFASLLATLPRPLYRTLAYQSSQAIDLIVTNVPGVPVVRYLAGAEIVAAWPFAPVGPHCPVSIALYGYRDRLYVGLDADATSFPDLEEFRRQLARSFDEVVEAARTPAPRRAARGARAPSDLRGS
jgi:WS/DGAT/MGAT family acyltransferase